MFCYLRDAATGALWSSAYQPTRRPSKKYEAIFVQGRAEYRRRDEDIDAHTEIAVSPEDDVEVRRITLTNLSRQTRTIDLTSYAEVVLAPLNTDARTRLSVICSCRRRFSVARRPFCARDGRARLARNRRGCSI